MRRSLRCRAGPETCGACCRGDTRPRSTERSSAIVAPRVWHPRTPADRGICARGTGRSAKGTRAVATACACAAVARPGRPVEGRSPPAATPEGFRSFLLDFPDPSEVTRHGMRLSTLGRWLGREDLERPWRRRAEAVLAQPWPQFLWNNQPLRDVMPWYFVRGE